MEGKKIGSPKEWHSDVERLKPEEHYQTVAKKQQGAGVENEDAKGRALQGLARGPCPHVLTGISDLPKKTQLLFSLQHLLTCGSNSKWRWWSWRGMVTCTFSHSTASHFCNQPSSGPLVFPNLLITRHLILLTLRASQADSPPQGFPHPPKMVQLMRENTSIPSGSKDLELVAKGI